ncbi:MAG: HlyD family secretion protein [Sphingomonadales bacterium]|nr:HlyD family secretion protein [Sphingomonadales bacterium]
MSREEVLSTEKDLSVKPARMRRILRVALLLIVPAIVIAVGVRMYLQSGRYAATDNAYVQQDIVQISPDVGGRIVEVLVEENDRVEAGDILFRIDPEPYRIAVGQAEAAIAEARLMLDRAQTSVSTSGVDISTARANVEYARRNLAREQELMNRGFNTRARVESYQNQLNDAQARLNAALAAQRDARAAAGNGGSAAGYPAIAAARARRDEAQFNLDRTVVRAPTAGTISQSERLQVGQVAAPGQPMVALVTGEGAWIEANFKETDLDRMRVGQRARITFDAYPGLAVRGRVESIGAGTGSEFSVLPAQNATGNWVKVTQRVPVRIAIEGNPPRAMIAGLSAHVSVDIRDDEEE